MKIILRTAIRFTALALIVTILYFYLLSAGYIAPLGSVDAVSSATTISSMDDIDGKYYVFINRERHKDTLEKWKKFFKGENVGFIMEDITCSVALSDKSGMETAGTYRSRLPQNQMNVKPDSAVLTVSKAKNGIFDVLILSENAVEAYGAEKLFKDSNVETIHMSSEVKNEKN